MVFRRKTFRRKRRIYRRRRPLAKIVRNLQFKNSETKHHNVVSGGFDYVGSVSGTLIHLTAIAQGSSDFTRVGNRCSLQKILVSKVFRIVQSTSAQQAVVRIMAVQSRGAPLTTSDFPVFYGPADLDKMIVLRDMMLPLSSGTSDYATGNGITINPKRVNLKLSKFKRRYLHFNDSSTVPTNAPVYLFLLASAANTVEQAGYESTYFKDL